MANEAHGGEQEGDQGADPPGLRGTDLAGLRARLEARRSPGPALILDGATGTELERLGVHSDLPLWSARALLEAPATLRSIHRAWAKAGAHVLTANTFRTQRRTLEHAGLGQRDAELTRLAVQLAREAARESQVVMGSIAPLEDCYRPDLVPNDDALADEHARHAANLADAGVDGMLVETIGTRREARAALRAARATGLPVWISFVSTVDGDGRAGLLSGERLSDAAREAADLGADALLVNCVPVQAVAPALDALAEGGLPFGAYPNMGAPLPVGGSDEALPRFDREVGPDALREIAAGWLERGARLLGGCCGTRPEHIEALAQLERRSDAR